MEKRIEIWGKQYCEPCHATGVCVPESFYKFWGRIYKRAIDNAARGGLAEMRIAHEAFQTKLLQMTKKCPPCSSCSGHGIVMKILGYKTLGEVASPDYWKDPE